MLRRNGSGVLVAGAVLVFVAGLCLVPVSESDLFFRLKVGEEILARGHLVGRNLFSFTYPDHPDLDLAWGFEVAAALLHRAGGFAAVVVAKTAVVLVAFAAAFALARRRGAGPVAAAVALVAAALVMRERLVERPHVVSFAGEMAALAAAARLDRRWSARALAAFAAAMLVWANMHAGVFVAVLLLGLAAAGAAASGTPAGRAAARRGLALAAIAAGAACLTPVGPLGLGRYLALHLSLPAIHTVDEFRAVTWRSDAPFVVLVAATAGAVAAAAWLARRRGGGEAPGGVGLRAALPDLLPAVGMVALAVGSVRFAADAALVAAPLLAAAIARAGRAAAGGGWAQAPFAAGTRPAAVLAARVLAAAALIGAAMWPHVADARAGRAALDLGLDAGSLPAPAALRFVEEHGLRERMYNDFEIGSYLAFQGFPRYRVFVDPRLPAYPEEMHRLLGAFDLDRGAWDAAMSRYGVDSALLAYAGVNRRVSWWDPERWALVWRAGDARVFVRRLPRWRDLIAAFELPATFSFTVEEGTATWPLDPQPAASPVPGCEWQRRLGDLLFDLDRGALGRARPHYDRALAAAGCLAAADEAALAALVGGLDLRAGRARQALPLLDRALALAPGDVYTHANRAAAYQMLGRRAEAAADWARVAAAAAGTPLGATAQAAAAEARRALAPSRP